MSDEPPKPRVVRRWPLVVGAVVLALVAAIGICEALGWPFLVGPMQRALSASLDRRVTFGSAGHEQQVKIRLLGRVRVSAAELEIAAPDWSQDPYMLRARNASVSLSYLDLWRAHRGGALHVRRLQADRLDLKLERLADGRASWQFGAQTKPPGASRPLPIFGLLRVGDGTLSLHDAIEPADLDAHFSLREHTAGLSGAASGAASTTAAISIGNAGAPSAPGGVAAASAASAASATAAGLQSQAAGLRFQATGHYRNLPLKIDLQTRGALPQSIEALARTPQPMMLSATVGHSDLTFRGTATDPTHLTGLRGRFSLAGPSLAAIGDPLGITLPTTPAFRAHGLIVKDGAVWKAVFEDATVGTSQLRGAFTYDQSHAVPLLAGRLEGEKLALADLGPAIGTAPPRNEPGETAHAPGAKRTAARAGKVLPNRRFDLPSLRRMNANIEVDVADVDLGSSLLEPLRPLRTHLQLNDGVLTLSQLDARTAEGRLEGTVRLDGRQPRAHWTSDLRVLGVNLQRWIHQSRGADQPPYVGGLLDTQVKVTGTGRSTAELLGSMNGTLRFHVRNGEVSHFAVEVAGIDVAGALGILVTGDKALPIDCNIADLKVTKGVAQPRIFVIDTTASTVWISGHVSLARETMDLTAFVSPKDFSPVSLRSPIRVKGTFANPAVSVEAGKIGAKVGAAALLALLNPLAAVIPLIDPGAKADARHQSAECSAVVQRVSAALKRPIKPLPKVR